MIRHAGIRSGPGGDTAGETRRLLIGGALLLAVVVAAIAYAPGLLARGGGTPRFELYVSDAPNGTALVPLDPETLADLKDGASRDLGMPAGSWTLSADGSTLAGIDYDRKLDPAGRLTIVVRDAATGAERARFPAPANVVFPRLSADGKRLVVQTLSRGVPATDWYVLDTGNGQVLTRVTAVGPSGGPSVVDAAARRLYHLTLPSSPAGEGPGPSAVVVHDLETGAEVGRLALPDVLGGTWQLPGQTQGSSAFAYLSPGWALSPDGRWLAIARADAEAVTLVDAERLAVARTISLARPVGLLDLLPLAPRPAWAKEFEGTSRQMVFGPDGRRLYVFGLETTFEDGERMAYRGLGVRLLDAERGQLVAEALPDERFDQVIPAPDGRSLYLLGPRKTTDTVSVDGSRYVLRRLDAATLAVLASRELDGLREILVRPVTDDGRRPGDPDVPSLATMAEQATRRAREVVPDAVLRQVVVDADTGRSAYLFTDAAATREVTVEVSESGHPASEWRVAVTSLSKLVGQPRPSIDLGALRVGSAAAARSIADHWPGCRVRHVTLVGEEDALTWVVFCELPDGRLASGSVDGRTGAFRPSPAPPASPPGTATPAP